MRVLVVGGSPEVAAVETIRRAAHGCDAVVAVDAGLDALRSAGVEADLFCGDADSVGPAGAAAVRAAERTGGPMEVERYRPHKDYSDLNLALDAVARRWPGATVCGTCLSGGRPDHFLEALGCLLTWEGPVELVEDAFCGRILKGGEAWHLPPEASGRTFSFIPVAPAAEVSIAGMRWELDRRRCTLLEDLGISNVVEGEAPQISCHEGTIACWLFTK